MAAANYCIRQNIEPYRVDELFRVKKGEPSFKPQLSHETMIIVVTGHFCRVKHLPTSAQIFG